MQTSESAAEVGPASGGSRHAEDHQLSAAKQQKQREDEAKGGGRRPQEGAVSATAITSRAATSTTPAQAPIPTPLGDIVLGRPELRTMSVLRVRRLALTLMQCRHAVLKEEDRRGGLGYQDFASWAVDQLLLLYGSAALAHRRLCEFAYGLRVARWRRLSEDEHGREPEPILHFFWRASQLGVPSSLVAGNEDIDFFCELLGAVADLVGNDRMLDMSAAAFWSAVGAAVELVLPLSTLTAALRKAYARSRSELFRQMNDAITNAARRYSRALMANGRGGGGGGGGGGGEGAGEGGGGIAELRGYTRTVLGGGAALRGGGADDDGGEGASQLMLPLEAFLKHCVACAAEERHSEGERLKAAFASWDAHASSSYDAFYEMLRQASDALDERRLIWLYEQALDPANPGLVDMARIEGYLRRLRIDVQPKDADASGLASIERSSKALMELGGTEAIEHAATRLRRQSISREALGVGGGGADSAGGVGTDNPMSRGMSRRMSRLSMEAGRGGGAISAEPHRDASPDGPRQGVVSMATPDGGSSRRISLQNLEGPPASDEVGVASGSQRAKSMWRTALSVATQRHRFVRSVFEQQQHEARNFALAAGFAPMAVAPAIGYGDDDDEEEEEDVDLVVSDAEDDDDEGNAEVAMALSYHISPPPGGGLGFGRAEPPPALMMMRPHSYSPTGEPPDGVPEASSSAAVFLPAP